MNENEIIVFFVTIACFIGMFFCVGYCYDWYKSTRNKTWLYSSVLLLVIAIVAMVGVIYNIMVI